MSIEQNQRDIFDIIVAALEADPRVTDLTTDGDHKSAECIFRFNGETFIHSLGEVEPYDDEDDEDEE